MWLIDVNIDIHLRSILKGFGIESESAVYRRWGTLKNGELVEAAVNGGFKVLLTRDADFGLSAAKNLRRFPGFCVVILHVPQRPWQEFAQDFLAHWNNAPIAPKPGILIHWPSTLLK